MLTHGTHDEDSQLARQITATPRTYILGGHDHDIETVDYSGEIFIGKNRSNAETMRVMLPLAGGRSIFNEVYAAYARLQARQPDNEPLQYPGDLEAVMLTASNLDREVLMNRIHAGAPADGSNLKDALTKARREYDIPAYVLTYADHDMSDVAADEIIQEALGKLREAGDDKEVCDFSKSFAKFEARDSFIRIEPTNMGVFVAECVRRQARELLEAKAQPAGSDGQPASVPDPVVAIINSGAFRCDSELEPKLTVWDLRETFLFDKDDAIMVLTVPADVVRELARHGQAPAKLGTGAFPQIAGDWKDATGEISLAISSFLLTRSDNNDGYDEVLHKFWGSPKGLLNVAATREAADKESNVRFGIIDAIKEQAAGINASPPNEMLIKPAVKTRASTGQISKLLDTYVKTFRKEMPQHENTSANMESFLGKDAPIPQSQATQNARDAVRAFLRELRPVADYSNLPAHSAKTSKGKADSRKAWTAAQKELTSLRRSLLSKDNRRLRGHESSFWLFGVAARDIPGWGDLPSST